MTSYAPNPFLSTRQCVAFDSFTVIVSASKAEAFPRRSIESVVGQLRPGDQLILVDVGGTTETTMEMTRWADEDSRIIVVHRALDGVGSARNAGLEFASGSYVLFLDFGAELAEGALDTLRSSIRVHRNPDMLIGGYQFEYCGQTTIIKAPPKLQAAASERLQAFLFEKKIRIQQGAVAYRRAAIGVAPFTEFLSADEDTPILASILSSGICVTVQETLAVVYQRPAYAMPAVFNPEQCIDLVDEVFSRLPWELNGMRQPYMERVCLLGFRTAVKGGWYRGALVIGVHGLRVVIRKWLRRWQLKSRPRPSPGESCANKLPENVLLSPDLHISRSR